MVFRDIRTMKTDIRLKPGSFVRFFNLRLKTEAIEKTFLPIALLTLICISANGQQPKDYARWVNPFIGTGGHGHTFPGAVLPFGMVQLSPDTRTDNWDGSSGYHYSDDIIYGFSHTHLSGTGIPDGCDILFMPTIGDNKIAADLSSRNPNGFVSRFSHANERAEPGYYSIRLDDTGILAELTATPRVGFHRYTFPSTDTGNVVIDLDWRDKVLASQLKIVDKFHVEGFRRSSSWAKDQVVYFVAEFSEPIANISSTMLPSSAAENSQSNIENLSFRLKANKQLLIKVAISPVSIEGARKNLAAELPGWDFDKVRADARAAWNKELGKIEVSGGTEDQTTTFYTALYHTMIHPSLFNDVDGSYLGHDGKIHNIKDDGVSGASANMQKPARKQGRNAQRVDYALLNGRTSSPSDNYTVFSLWDTFRAAHPLYTIIDQKRTVDFINTFIRIYEQGGRLPVWELWGNETDCMIGYHAVSVIADAMAKGIKGFDYKKAYEAAKHSAELDHFGLAAYKRRGYISQEDDDASVSKTLEYAYDDWCIAQMAEILSRVNVASHPTPEQVESYRADEAEYSRRARSFENVFDPSTGFMRPKKNGGFLSPFAPNEVTFNYTEGNAWVYSFFVPQMVGRLGVLMGGREKFAAKLDELFTTSDKLAGREQPDITGLIGQYAHGIEPSHHIAYLYDYAGQPWKTQKYVRRIMDDFYKNAPDGLIGNEDCGQMSAWYVLSASGIYPVAPGSQYFAIGTPLFPRIIFHLENGNVFEVTATGLSKKNIYLKSTSLDNRSLFNPFVTYEEIKYGGKLHFQMTSTPNTTEQSYCFAGSCDSRFFSFLGDRSSGIVTPVIGDGRQIFRDFIKLTISAGTPNTKIYYTLNGSEPSEKSLVYKGPITINSATRVKAVAINEKGVRSQVAEASYQLNPNNWTVKIDSKYNSQYTGGGDEGLIDGIRGTTTFASGEWQGYQGQDFVATVDLQKLTQIKMLGAGFLQNVRSWIWMPTHIEFEYSRDGVEFSKIAEIKTDVAQDNMDPVTRDYLTPIKPLDARYIRIHAYSLGKIPAWHPGAGGDGWIFVDEIFID